MVEVSANNIIDSLPTYTGNNTPQGPKAATDLGQDDFLTLLTTQLQNQDPFQPMENGEFLAQMAQFSTVSGIEDVNQTLNSLGESMGQFRVSMAATMLGQHVLVPGSVARPDDHGMVSGAVDFENPVESVTIKYENAQTGEIYHKQELGAQAAGMMGFSWDDIPQSLIDANKPIRVGITAVENGQATYVGPSVFARVMGVSMNQDTIGVNLNVRDYGVVNSMEVEQMR